MGPAQPTDAPAEGTSSLIVVHVVRSGGFAGLNREWTAEPRPPEAERFKTLIDECPWDEATEPAPTRGADRFMWLISAMLADEPPLEAELPDTQLQGPWRELVDEVRAYDDGGALTRHHVPRPSPGPSPTDGGRREPSSPSS
jgi:hypothetical protein